MYTLLDMAVDNEILEQSGYGVPQREQRLPILSDAEFVGRVSGAAKTALMVLDTIQQDEDTSAQTRVTAARAVLSFAMDIQNVFEPKGAPVQQNNFIFAPTQEKVRGDFLKVARASIEQADRSLKVLEDRVATETAGGVLPYKGDDE